ncbi:flippase [Tamilnaduibacter salinus]|uniref:flippase n=1 Tax=Tamilnaduibacter salinus TaxID=1484056 RepID=UPI00130426E8|nr:flippase [Tamilnaduibacter salinus]
MLSLKALLKKGGIASLAVKLTNTAMVFGISVLLARTLGADGFGIYSFVLAMVQILVLPAAVGLPQLVVRETAKAGVRKDWGRLRGLWQWASRSSLIFSLIMIVVLTGIAKLMSLIGEEGRASTLLAGALLIPFVALGRLRDGALRGLGKVIIGQVSDMIIRPLLLIIFVFSLVTTNFYPLSATVAMALNVSAAACAFLFGAFLLRRATPVHLSENPTPDLDKSGWWAAAIPLGMMAGLNMINQHADILLLGVFRPDDEVGVYRVAVQAAMLVAFGLHAIEMVVIPQFARLYASENFASLQRLVTVSARLTSLLAIPIVVVYWVLGERFLSLIFGDEFAIGYLAMSILAAGQLMNALFGSVKAILNMGGCERESMRAMMWGVGINLTLNIILVPPFGGNGAAIATAASVVFWNARLWVVARRRVGIDTLAIPVSRPSTRGGKFMSQRPGQGGS